MRLRIPFNEIRDAIEHASYEHHYLIDTKKHTIVFISEYEDDHEKKLEDIERLIKDFNPDAVVFSQAFPCGLVSHYKKIRNLESPILKKVIDLN